MVDWLTLSLAHFTVGNMCTVFLQNTICSTGLGHLSVTDYFDFLLCVFHFL